MPFSPLLHLPPNLWMRPMRGEPFLIRLLFGGLLKPQIKTLGTDGAGRVEAVGTASP